MQADAEGVGQQRSLKYFQGLARGCWLVRWAWVEACAAAGEWLDEAPFELAGDHFALGAPHTGYIPMLAMAMLLQSSSEQGHSIVALSAVFPNSQLALQPSASNAASQS